MESESLGLKRIEDIKEQGGGIYFIYNQQKELMYIGQTVNIQQRLMQHTGNWTSKIDIQHNFYYADYILIKSKKERMLAELRLINMLQPKLNIAGVSTYTTQYYSSKYNSLYSELDQKEFQDLMDKALEDFEL